MIAVDAFGFAGLALAYALVGFFTIGAFFLFAYFWWNRKLDFDEGPKYQMLKREEHEQ